MNNAYESREEYSKDGKVIKRERRIGAIVGLVIIALVTGVHGQSLPTGILQLISWVTQR